MTRTSGSTDPTLRSSSDSERLSLETIEKYLQSLTMNGASPHTIRAYRSDLIGLKTWMDQHPLMDLETAVAEWLTWGRKTWAPKTTNRKLTTARSFGRFLSLNLLPDYRPPKAAPGVAHPIPEGIPGVVTMYHTARKDAHKAAIVLCGALGLRISEARQVRTVDFTYHGSDRVLMVRGKGDKQRFVPVSDDVWELLANLNVSLDGALVPLTDRAVRRAITRTAARAGCARPVASHDLRMTFGTAAYNQSGGDIRAVQELLGHASTQTTENYTHVTMDKKKAAAGVL